MEEFIFADWESLRAWSSGDVNDDWGNSAALAPGLCLGAFHGGPGIAQNLIIGRFIPSGRQHDPR